MRFELLEFSYEPRTKPAASTSADLPIPTGRHQHGLARALRHPLERVQQDQDLCVSPVQPVRQLEPRRRVAQTDRERCDRAGVDQRLRAALEGPTAILSDDMVASTGLIGA